ncbi:hypothetical protein T439DRAFT_326136 [Meredithblackwellia eburnea MCA 4105]
MNSLYTLALRQSASIQADLASYEQAIAQGSQTSGLNGQITASLAALDRTVEDYDSMARREIVDEKREKALGRVARFREDYSALRKQYDKAKTTSANQKAANDRDALFASTTSGISSGASFSISNRRPNPLSQPPQQSTAESPFSSINMSSSSAPSSNQNNGNSAEIGGSIYRPNSPYRSEFNHSVHNNPRTKAALGENDFLSSTGQTLDAYIAQGQAVLNGLANQRDMLKGTKRKLLSAANTLGLSRSTIQYIERRTTGDFYILIIGGAFTLLSFYFILKWFG